MTRSNGGTSGSRSESSCSHRRLYRGSRAARLSVNRPGSRLGTGLLLEDRPRRLELDLAFTTKRPDVAAQERLTTGKSQLRKSDRFGAMLECSAQTRDRVGDTQPDESRSTTGALSPSWSATRVMAPRVIIA